MFIGEIKVRECIGYLGVHRLQNRIKGSTWIELAVCLCICTPSSMLNADCSNITEEFRCSNVHATIFKYRTELGSISMHSAVSFLKKYNVSFYPGLPVLRWLPIVILFQENCGEQNFLHVYSIHTHKYFSWKICQHRC